jgi:mono/diheme cytochrome c family protein
MRTLAWIAAIGWAAAGATAGAQEPQPAPAAPAAPAAGQAPSPVAILFGKKCGSCHTVGEGDRTGPDLLGVTGRRDATWLRRFIPNAGAVIDGGDRAANDLLAKFKGVRMPEQVLTEAQLTDLLGYLDDCTRKGGCKVVAGKVRHAREATAADVARGKRLFQGKDALSAGGPPCISCHDVRGLGLLGGGTLARELTLAYSRLGDAAISAGLADTPFPLMTTVYPRRPLRADEAFAIKAYLAATSRRGQAALPDRQFVYLGAIGLFLSLGAIGLFWRGRGQGHVVLEERPPRRSVHS